MHLRSLSRYVPGPQLKIRKGKTSTGNIDVEQWKWNQVLFCHSNAPTWGWVIKGRLNIGRAILKALISQCIFTSVGVYTDKLLNPLQRKELIFERSQCFHSFPFIASLPLVLGNLVTAVTYSNRATVHRWFFIEAGIRTSQPFSCRMMPWGSANSEERSF